jgi:hypothetical protein
LAVNARLYWSPAAIAVIPLTAFTLGSSNIVRCAIAGLAVAVEPQDITEPSLSSAREWKPPNCPRKLSPQAMTVPFLSRASSKE